VDPDLVGYETLTRILIWIRICFMQDTDPDIIIPDLGTSGFEMNLK
jgi:hypothetical protein